MARLRILARLAGRPETAVPDLRAHVLRRPAGEGDLEVVDDPGPVEGQALDESSLHEVDEDRLEPDLDDVGAAAEEDRLPVAAGLFHEPEEGRGSRAQPRTSGREPRNVSKDAPAGTGFANAAASTLLRRPRRG